MDDQAGKGFSGKSELERTLAAGIHGTPELRGDEKAQYLGEFRERVLRMLNKSQVWEPVAYQEIETALKDPRAALMVVHGDINESALSKYKKWAEAYGKPVTTRRAAEYTGETGLIVVAPNAVDVADITVEERRERLMKRGLPEQLIEAAGEAVCKDCYNKLKEEAPEEVKHYKMLSPISRLLGERCPGHEI